MTNEFAACVLTGREAGADGVCAEHGETACVLSVRMSPLVSDCVIPGFQCTHDHHNCTVDGPPIPEQRQRS